MGLIYHNITKQKKLEESVMPVPTIPSAISLADIQTEFGGSNPIGINEYYAGAVIISKTLRFYVEADIS